MNEDFVRLVRELHKNCDGNLSEVSRKTGLSLAYLHQTLSGAKASRDPHTDTWIKVYRALGRNPPTMVREIGIAYSDKFSAFAEWLRKNPDRFPIFEQMAKEFGYKKESL